MKSKNLYAKKLREKWKSEGKCSHCGGDRMDGDGALCSKCKIDRKQKWDYTSGNKKEKVLKMKSINAKKRTEKLISIGVCVRCRKNKSETNKIHCRQCLDRLKENCQKRLEKGICMTCGNQSISGQYYCETCADRKNQKARDRKWEAIMMKGEKCEKCGLIATKKNFILFDFNHLDKSEKENALSYMLRGNAISEKAKAELNKCNLLCVFCHRMYHFLSDEDWLKYKGETR